MIMPKGEKNVNKGSNGICLKEISLLNLVDGGKGDVMQPSTKFSY
jgi:hypothetical protein